MNYTVEHILKKIKTLTRHDEEHVVRAFSFAQKNYHNAPYAASKENNAFPQEEKTPPYEIVFKQSCETASTLAGLGMDVKTIAAGLLSNILRYGYVTEEELKNEVDEETLFLVKGVTTLTKHRYTGLDRHKESLRKLLLVISKDIRVLIIKLAERLHRFESLPNDPPEKQLRVALETLEIYAPIANRLGMGKMRGALEDLAFPHVYPKEYVETKELLKKKSTENHVYLEKVHRVLQKELHENNIAVTGMDYRMKHLYSLYQKLPRYEMDIEKIYDIAALRVIVATVDDCYRTVGVIHGIWKQLPGRIKDYIASPKYNGYQSLHTTIETGDGGIVEIQIRTQKMHDDAEFGIASHLIYKEVPKNDPSFFSKRLEWLRELSRFHKDIKEGTRSPKDLKLDFFQDRVFVFTPRGDVIDLPQNATPVDFAYAIHSEIGDRMAGAKINGKLCALHTKLQNGDVVEIVTKRESFPSSKWLEYAKTPFAKKRIKSTIQKRDGFK